MAISFAAGTESIRTSGNFAELAVATVCMWFRPHSVTGNNRLIGTDTAWEARLNGSDMLMEFLTGSVPNMTTVFAIDTWYHLAFAFDGTNKGAWVNGVEDPALAALAHSAVGNDTILSVGTATWNDTQGMDGELEDLRMYNRVLSNKEVAQIYNGNGQDGILRGLQHWWPLQNGSDGSVVTFEPDLVNKTHLSTIVGSPVYTKSPRRFLRGVY